MGSQKSNLTGVFSPSPSKKQCTSRGEKKVDLIGPAYIRMHLLGFAFDLDALQFGFINPGSIESVRKGVRQTMEHVSTVRNAAREKEKMVLLKFTHRPGPNPKVAGSKDKCPFGFSAGVESIAPSEYPGHKWLAAIITAVDPLTDMAINCTFEEQLAALSKAMKWTRSKKEKTNRLKYAGEYDEFLSTVSQLLQLYYHHMDPALFQGRTMEEIQAGFSIFCELAADKYTAARDGGHLDSKFTGQPFALSFVVPDYSGATGWRSEWMPFVLDCECTSVSDAIVVAMESCAESANAKQAMLSAVV